MGGKDFKIMFLNQGKSYLVLLYLLLNESLILNVCSTYKFILKRF